MRLVPINTKSKVKVQPVNMKLLMLGQTKKMEKETERVNFEFRCPICFEAMGEPSTLKCYHSYCIQCISEHLKSKNNCPMCKASVVEKITVNTKLQDKF